MSFSRVLGVNMHLFCIDAGAASSRKCTHLPNNYLLLFVLKTINPGSIVHQAISNHILSAYLKNRHTTIAFLVSKKSAKLVEESILEPNFPPMYKL